MGNQPFSFQTGSKPRNRKIKRAFESTRKVPKEQRGVNYANHRFQRFPTHLSLNEDAPAERMQESGETRKIGAFPMVGGLHHSYTSRAA